MPIYRFSCRCGFTGDQFLKADKDNIVLTCPNCRRGASARQVRDKSVKFVEKDGVIGMGRDDA